MGRTITEHWMRRSATIAGIREGLATLLANRGYQLQAMLQFNRVSKPGWRFTGQVLKSRTLSPAGMRIFDQFVWLWRRIDRRLPWEPTSIIAIARRPD
jgi:hypothetical protein